MKYTKIRTEIKRLSEEQISLKPQRKTTSFTGVRTIEPSTATYMVVANKDTLRHLFEVYAILRGKERQICVKKEINKLLVDALVLKYQEE